ncbi:hypothetical protein RhiirA5_438250 [Rhizophagus irregularis]|uniref:Uncharacterized protein n=1 Tax=Rhizophagus irregularis TaxID=588596 RepID=A0A2N0NJC7_9GLOM|nr:hypothetical protein RhiirA5_439743 [Rhizophagus irregularis]PKB94503.1 hypothetical protein RhiirA5_438622 [Rhizophagus irregularis]PKB94682.1 hypothetical protein RhiirA5_438250 [Rhizophagus irregularis]
MNNSIINLLILDCNRHRLALKILANILKIINNINNCNISNLIKHITDRTLFNWYDYQLEYICQFILAFWIGINFNPLFWIDKFQKF